MSIQFISVVREGLSRGLPITDSGGDDTTLDSTPIDDALALTVSATLNSRSPVGVPLRLLGLREIDGVDSALAIRTDPSDGAQSVDTSRFPLVEFDAPGLPWMFTPLAANRDRLRPWIALVVVPFDGDSPLDLGPIRDKKLPVLTVERAEDLPPIGETWAWAHAQVVTGDSSAAVTDLDRLVATDAEGTLSRLLCPCRLVAGRHYVACVVPTFEAARTAALGEQPDATVAPAWGRPGTKFPLRLPVLVHWEFFTGDAGDFETTVRRLRGVDAPAPSGRVIDASKPGSSLVEDDTANALSLAGALRPDKLVVTPYAGPAVKGYEQLARTGEVVTAGGRRYPVVDLPLYGGRHVGVSSATAPSAPAWVHELNTDPRHRVVAALGARIVRDNQEALMTSAWQQAGDVDEANRRLRRARLGRAASTRIVAQHIEPLDDVDRLCVLAPSFGRLGIPQTNRTLAGLVDESRVPNRVLTSGFTALTRPSGLIGRQFRMWHGTRPELVRAIDDGTAVIDRTELGRPGGLVTLDSVVGVLDAARDSLGQGGERVPVATGTATPTQPGVMRVDASATGEGRRATRMRVTDRAGMLGGGTLTVQGDLALPSGAAMRRIDPGRLTGERVRALSGMIQVTVGDRTVDVTDAHREALADLFAPVEDAAVVEPAALDVGMVAAEAFVAVDPATTIARAVLSKLELPAAAGRTDPLDDVLAAPQFPSPLARELIRLAPDLVLPGIDEVAPDRVFAVVSNSAFVQAVLVGANHEMMRELRWRGYPTDERGTAFHRFWREDADEIPDVHTLTSGHLGDAVSRGLDGVVVVVRSDLFTRFPGTLVFAVPARVSGSTTTPDFSSPQLPTFRGTLAADVTYFGFPFSDQTATRSPGRYLAFQEPATSPTFGLDTESTVNGFPAKASDLAWTNAPMKDGFVSIDRPGAVPFTDIGATWGANAADQAASTYQRPVRAAVHFRDLLQAS